MSSLTLPALALAAFGCLLMTSLRPAVAAPGESAGTIHLSRPLPIAGEPVRVFLEQNAAAAPLRFTVRSEATGEVVAEADAAPVDGGVGIEFTPTETGYHIAAVKPEGSAEEPRTLRFPVVYRDLRFLMWPKIGLEEAGLRCLASQVIVQKADENREQVEAWHRRGTKVLGATFTGSRQVDLSQSDEQNVEKLVTAWTKSLAEICDGIYIDEIGMYPTPDGHRRAKIISEALKQFRKAHPDKAIYVAVAGSPLLEMAAGMKAAEAVALLETYESWLQASFVAHRFYDYLDRRVEIVRSTDLIQERGKQGGSLIFIGYDGMHGGTLKTQLEDHVRYARRAAPEMPGMAFYASNRTSNWLADEGMREFAEELCERYFVRPVLEANHIWLEETTPRAGEEARITVRVHNIGGMQARDVGVRLYASPVGLNERQEIGTATIQTLGVGQADMTDASLETLNDYKLVEVGGERLPVFNNNSIVPLDRASAHFNWTPPTGGAYTLHAVLEAQPGVTILTGVKSVDVIVAGGGE